VELPRNLNQDPAKPAATLWLEPGSLWGNLSPLEK